MNEVEKPDISALDREEARDLFRKLLAADSAAIAKYRREEMGREKVMFLREHIAAVVDGIVTVAMGDPELAAMLTDPLIEKMKEGPGNPLPYGHILQTLCFKHRLVVDGERTDPGQVSKSIKLVCRMVDIDDAEDEWAEIKEEMEENLEEHRERWNGNTMFG